MNRKITNIIKEVYDKCGLEMADFEIEPESKEYEACLFSLNGKRILCRNAKQTPRKQGQFVTFWKRKGKGPIEPFDARDPIDFFVVNVHLEEIFGQFVFPKSVLIEKGILSTDKKEGKRAFRVYPYWDQLTSTQAERTQKWQSDYFYEIDNNTDFNMVLSLFNKE